MNLAIAGAQRPGAPSRILRVMEAYMGMSAVVRKKTVDVAEPSLTQVHVIPFQSYPLDEAPLTEQELLSVYAVLAHIAYSQDIRQELLQAMVEAEFSVTHIAKLPRRRIHEVMEFLIDLRMDSIRSRK